MAIRRFKAGVITKMEFISSFHDSFEFAYDASGLKAIAQQLPQEMFTAVDNEVSEAPQSEQEWARFRLMLGCSYLDEQTTPNQIEDSLADSQAKYYRFVTAWRKAFSTSGRDFNVR